MKRVDYLNPKEKVNPDEMAIYDRVMEFMRHEVSKAVAEFEGVVENEETRKKLSEAIQSAIAKAIKDFFSNNGDPLAPVMGPEQLEELMELMRRNRRDEEPLWPQRPNTWPGRDNGDNIWPGTVYYRTITTDNSFTLNQDRHGQYIGPSSSQYINYTTDTSTTLASSDVIESMFMTPVQRSLVKRMDKGDLQKAWNKQFDFCFKR